MNGLLAGVGVLAGWWAYGWQGIVFAASVVVFWLLLQFSRANRVIQQAAQRPVGSVPNAVMFQSRLDHGLTMQEVLKLAGSLGRKVGPLDDWQWSDAAGTDVVVSFRRGVVVRWAMARAPQPDEPPAPLTGAGD